MRYNRNEIYGRILKNIEIDRDEFNCDYVDERDFSGFLPDDCAYAYGASKFVIIPKHRDYVIKIPFSVQTDREDNGYWEGDDYIEDYGPFIPFSGAVYPIEGTTGWDYCRAEAEYYKLASAAGLGQFFAKTKFIGKMRGFPIYVQEKCEMYKDVCLHHTIAEREDTLKRASSLTNSCMALNLSHDFLIELMKNVDLHKIDKLFNFIEKYNITDLRSYNYGFRIKDHSPVFTDYSSYDD